MTSTRNTDILIIGSGLSGLSLALSMPKNFNILIVTKDKLDSCSTAWAQGGIAAVIGNNDSLASHIKDTIDNGHGLCNLDVVNEIINNGPECINWLEENQIQFTRINNKIDLTLEGGHSNRRISYIKDQTGRFLHNGLTSVIKKIDNVTILENTQIIDLIHEYNDNEKRCLGAYLYNKDTHKVTTVKSKFSILATGGASKIYQYTTNPHTSTGDGIAAAWRAGCTVTNMEFIQFHPTCLYHPENKSFLISESLRGEGAKLLGKDLQPFMHHYDSRCELAPRDVVARAIDNEIKTKGLKCVFLDITMKDKAFITNRFPAIYEKCLKMGIKISEELIPVVPASHYTCGGVQVDISGETEIKNLFVIGEAAHTGFHGANRLASNSLLECVVMARKCAENILSKNSTVSLTSSIPPWDDSYVTESSEKFKLSHNWDDLRKIMWNYVGIIRTKKNLSLANEKISLIEKEVNQYYQKYYITSDLLELRNIIQISKLIIKSAMSRKESRGLHFTKDYPLSNDIFCKNTEILGRENEYKSRVVKFKV